MNSDQLRNFRVIAESGNLTKAAERLYITQPALSMSLTKLEDEIGKLLFVREGRQMTLTENGKILLRYAKIVTDAIDEVKDIFRVPEEVEEVRIYRIGGVGASLLLSGCYDLPDYRLKLKLIHNYDTPDVVGQAIACIMIADEKYMNTALYKGVERILLYKQHMLLSVREDSELAQRDSIDVSELEHITMIGRSASKGFNDWIDDVSKENRVNLRTDLHCDYAFYITEAQNIPWPYLMSSFGLGIAKSQPYFEGRKTLRVTGKYTERDIYLWYDNRIKRQLQPYINLITANAQAVNRMDAEV